MILNLPDGTSVDVRRMVVKLGTKQVTDLSSVNHRNVANIVKEIAWLKDKGVDVILTASGAIGLGVQKLHGNRQAIDKLTLPQKQAIAGFGQVELMNLFKAEFAKHGIDVGQVLLTYTIIENRSAFQNAGNTLNAMLDMGLVPVINENDSVAVDEIKVGDNDRLGAYVCQIADADLYVMLSDIDGFYKNYGAPDQEFLRIVPDVRSVETFARRQEENYTKGGMITKLQAALTNSVNGVYTVIANGLKDGILSKIMNGLSEGTIFIPAKRKLGLKKRWITGKKSAGAVGVDEGAAEALRKHRSLLASGIKTVSGCFLTGDKITITDTAGVEIAAGLANYSSEQMKKIAGKKSEDVKNILGRDYGANCAVHVDNMVLYQK